MSTADPPGCQYCRAWPGSAQIFIDTLFSTLHSRVCSACHKQCTMTHTYTPYTHTHTNTHTQIHTHGQTCAEVVILKGSVGESLSRPGVWRLSSSHPSRQRVSFLQRARPCRRPLSYVMFHTNLTPRPCPRRTFPYGDARDCDGTAANSCAARKIRR
jgi:hypothetical protein